jgi:hypothetical protein
MALKELSLAFGRLAVRDARPIVQSMACQGRRSASSAAARHELSEDTQDLESQSSFSSEAFSEEAIQSYDPVKRASSRKTQLPRSRYVGLDNLTTVQPLTIVQIPISTSTILPRTPTPSSTTAPIRSIIETLCARPIRSSSTRTDVPINCGIRLDDPYLCS